MELRFRSADADSEHFGNLLMLKALDIVQDKNRSVSAGQFLDCFVKCQPVNVTRTFSDRLDDVLQIAYLAFLGSLFILHASFAEVHQDVIDRHTVQPGREGGFTTKTADFAEELNEDFLRQVFSLSRICQHT